MLYVHFESGLILDRIKPTRKGYTLPSVIPSVIASGSGRPEEPAGGLPHG